MRLRAGCQLTLIATSPQPLVAMLRPRSGVGQWIVEEKYAFEPFVEATEYVDCFGNLCQRLTTPAGGLLLQTEVTVEVARDIAVKPGAPPTSIAELPEYTLQFLLPSRYCPCDTLESLAQEITRGSVLGYDQAEAVRAWIRENIEYRYGVSNGSTSATDTLRDKAGVCRDFAHIGISLCRALHIPARMVVGYLHRLTPMDLHAWFEAFVDGRWYTFDATQAEPRGGRIVIAYGRDAADVALFPEFGPIETRGMRVWVAEP